MKNLTVLLLPILLLFNSCQNDEKLINDEILQSIDGCAEITELQSEIVDTVFAEKYSDDLNELYAKWNVKELMRSVYEKEIAVNQEKYNNCMKKAKEYKRSRFKDEFIRISKGHKEIINDYKIELAKLDSLKNLHNKRSDIYYNYLNEDSLVLFYVVSFSYTCNDVEYSDTALLDCDFHLK